MSLEDYKGKIRALLGDRRMLVRISGEHGTGRAALASSLAYDEAAKGRRVHMVFDRMPPEYSRQGFKYASLTLGRTVPNDVEVIVADGAVFDVPPNWGEKYKAKLIIYTNHDPSPRNGVWTSHPNFISVHLNRKEPKPKPKWRKKMVDRLIDKVRHQVEATKATLRSKPRLTEEEQTLWSSVVTEFNKAESLVFVLDEQKAERENGRRKNLHPSEKRVRGFLKEILSNLEDLDEKIR